MKINRPLLVHFKQIMTGLEGNRQIYLSQEFLLTEAQPRPIGTLGEAILNLKGQIDSPKNYYFNWKLISSIMGLITKTHTLE